MTPSEEWNGKKDKKNRSKEDENQFIHVTKKKSNQFILFKAALLEDMK